MNGECRETCSGRSERTEREQEVTSLAQNEETLGDSCGLEKEERMTDQ